MKYLVYDLFSGVGLCNQLFSFETAIYLANILDRKLILFVKNPLCHCGRASWEYGYILNYFTNEYLDYLPHGIEVYYKTLPDELTKIVSNKENLFDSPRFSETVFIDECLNTQENKGHIKDYCRFRKEFVVNWKNFEEKEYLYMKTSNASRCLYNFYTSKDNYMLMYNICKSIKFQPIFYDIANEIYSSLINGNNTFNIFAHLRFGDYHKNESFITRMNDTIIKNLSEYFDGHKTNMINPTIYFLIDNRNNPKFINAMKKYNFKFVSDLVKDKIKIHLSKNRMLYSSFYNVSKIDVADAIIEMLLASSSDEFIGYSSSTFSHYIQYLRYVNNKSYYNYSNIKADNDRYCKLQPLNNSDIEWKRLEFSGGHPLSWHYFFKPFVKTSSELYTIEGKSDGFGSQLQACLSLIAYCHYKGFEYIHTPFSRMQHNDENLHDFPQIMNKFINIENKFRSYSSISNFEKSRLRGVKEGYFVHGSCHPEYFYTPEILDKIRECYYSNEKPNINDIFLPNKHNVVIHIRRGDVNIKLHNSRFTSNEDIIKHLHKYEKKDNIAYHIISEGKDDDFKDISQQFPNIRLHLNLNICKTFHIMVEADTLIMSKSSFCYSAALINKKIVDATFIAYWWHKPLKHWKKK